MLLEGCVLLMRVSRILNGVSILIAELCQLPVAERRDIFSMNSTQALVLRLSLVLFRIRGDRG
jgi:hypothetical protein